MRKCGWDVMDIMDGCFDIRRYRRCVGKISKSTNKPTFINVRTIISLESAVAGSATAHVAGFGVKDVAAMKEAYDFNPEEHFVISETVRDFAAYRRGCFIPTTSSFFMFYIYAAPGVRMDALQNLQIIHRRHARQSTVHAPRGQHAWVAALRAITNSSIISTRWAAAAAAVHDAA